MKFTPIKPPDNPEDDAQGRYKRLRPLNPHDHSHGHESCCGHDHHHDHNHEDHHDHPLPAKGLRGMFQRLAGNRTAVVLGGTTALLATTALTAPALATTLGAGLAMAASLWLLPQACETVIDSVESLGKKLKIPAVGLGLGLALMESVPEFAVAMKSILSGQHAVSMGNIVGSNIAHILMILGTVAAVAGVKKPQGTAWKFNVAALAGATTAFGTQLATGRLVEGLGYGMAAAAVAYLITNYKLNRRDALALGKPALAEVHHHHHHGGDDGDCGHDHKERSGGINVLLAAGGMGSVIYTAHTAVEGASTVAQNLGAPEVMVGALALALGTAAPEFAINVKAALKGKTDMAVGNIIGCSVLNLLAVGGVLAATGAPVPEALQPTTPMGLLNLTALGTGAGLATATLLATKGALKRWHGYAALSLYSAYLAGSLYLGTAQNEAPAIPEKTRPNVITPV
ncbi:MAG: sodium:calcium antiporter [Micavibrio aeruginosavorus]|uniref:Sodium:calcium antiporter n=1 Tax=Micavibrio aeruginosavorus TaxID=349221 RepID=A0A7T5R0G2_9BACT|nr:MAG: sodium:calcium antiporter [Micavibrio aeruginosavorus]